MFRRFASASIASHHYRPRRRHCLGRWLSVPSARSDTQCDSSLQTSGSGTSSVGGAARARQYMSPRECSRRPRVRYRTDNKPNDCV
jgi:hypothetical protein